MMKKKTPRVATYSNSETDEIVTFTHRGKKVEISDPASVLPPGVTSTVTTVARAASYKLWLFNRGFRAVLGANRT